MMFNRLCLEYYASRRRIYTFSYDIYYYIEITIWTQRYSGMILMADEPEIEHR